MGSFLGSSISVTLRIYQAFSPDAEKEPSGFFSRRRTIKGLETSPFFKEKETSLSLGFRISLIEANTPQSPLFSRNGLSPCLLATSLKSPPSTMEEYTFFAKASAEPDV